MKLGAISSLIASVFVIGVACGDTAPDEDWAQRYISSLQRKIKIDWNKPPVLDDLSSDNFGLKMGLVELWSLRCHEQVRLGTRRKLVPVYVDPKHSGIVIQPNTTVYYLSTVEKSLINAPGTDNVVISVSSSTTKIDSRTENWAVGAQLGFGSIGISAEVSKTRTTEEHETKIDTITATCKAGHICRFESWTLHVLITGYCEILPLIKCDEKLWAGCFMQFQPSNRKLESYRDELCRFRGERGVRKQREIQMEACEARLPILDQSGKPVTHIVLIMEEMESSANGNNTEDRRPQVAAEVVGKENEWYLLDSGEYYRRDRDEFWDGSKQSWVSKPRAPKIWDEKKQKWILKPRVPKPDIASVIGTTPPEVPVAVRVKEHFYLLDGDEEGYRDDTNQYYSSEIEDWVSMLHRPRPNLHYFDAVSDSWVFKYWDGNGQVWSVKPGMPKYWDWEKEHYVFGTRDWDWPTKTWVYGTWYELLTGEYYRDDRDQYWDCRRDAWISKPGMRHKADLLGAIEHKPDVRPAGDVPSSGKPSADAASAADGGKRVRRKAVRSENGWFVLDNEQHYGDDTNQYWDVDQQALG
ncbi:hypothetical protein CDD83_9983 [Cordyceps sp. RAO-2017]|nr:hypothetical protein CDD83_9983 [Cordyceps sp. RAO-2017]